MWSCACAAAAGKFAETMRRMPLKPEIDAIAAR